MLVWFFRTVHRFKNKRYSSSANSSGGLEPLAEDVNFKLARLYEDGPTPDQGILLVFLDSILLVKASLILEASLL